ncbi:MAG: hypothetical protein KF729_07345 [Sandaracinaceae bacterium]|nr:hypothetical protein [Sandaracinaceae bacterium]
MRARRFALSLASLGLLYALLVGPAPGNVGGCGADLPIADAREHCINRRFWECRRDLEGSRITMDEFTACLGRISSMCDAARWPDGCEPTRSSAAECEILLSRSDFVAISTPDLLMMYGDCNLCR